MQSPRVSGKPDPEMWFLKNTKAAKLVGAQFDNEVNDDGSKVNVFDDLSKEAPNLDQPEMLSIPPFANPMANLSECLVDEAGNDIKMNFNHGTTTLGFKYKNGTILAVDSRWG